MDLAEIIRRKRDGLELTTEEIRAFVAAAARLSAPEGMAGDTGAEAQLAALLMAIFLRGMAERELTDLTEAMRDSGEVFDAGGLGAFTVDKHSTGGVGDKTSLLVAPMVAAAGSHPGQKVVVPMISGRSLGHTGGTLDKLETIPGFNTQLSLGRMEEVLRQCGAAIVGQTPQLVPADRVLYALRDHTATVESPALITASILSKKLAEDLRGLVLDVKVGSGAFMPSYAASRQLAEMMVKTAERAGTRTVALLTSMEEPLGRFAGNWVEVWECVEVLRGERHPMSADLIELSCVLAGWMLYLAGRAGSPEQGAQVADETLRTGRAWEAWLCMVQAQGGDARSFEEPTRVHQPRFRRVLHAAQTGYLAGMDCKQVGWAVQRLGAGRSRPGEPVSAHAGLEVHAKLGSAVEQGQPLFTLFSEEERLLDEGYRMMESTLVYSDTSEPQPPLVREVVLAAGG